MPYNSLIKVKEKICISCGRPCYWFSRKRCKNCASVEDFNSKQEVQLDKEGLSSLIDELDTLISQYVRLKDCRPDLTTDCFTCDYTGKWTTLQCGHYISRAHMYLRHDLRNLRRQCEGCNIHKRGNILVYAERLEKQNPGITDILYEEKQIIYKPSREELKALILEYGNKVVELKRKLKI